MLKKYSLNALQVAINTALSLDEAMPDKLQALKGKVIEIVIAPLDVNFFIQFDEKLLLLDHYNEKVDTKIHSSPLGFIRLSLLPASKARSLFNEKIHISGDIELGQQIKKLFDELDIDWEGHIAHFTGDVVAHQLGSWVRKGLAFKKQVSDNATQTVSDFLQEECRVLVTRLELNDFYDEVDTLALDVDRLEAHVKQLMSANENN